MTNGSTRFQPSRYMLAFSFGETLLRRLRPPHPPSLFCLSLTLSLSLSRLSRCGVFLLRSLGLQQVPLRYRDEGQPPWWLFHGQGHRVGEDVSLRTPSPLPPPGARPPPPHFSKTVLLVLPLVVPRLSCLGTNELKILQDTAKHILLGVVRPC